MEQLPEKRFSIFHRAQGHENQDGDGKMTHRIYPSGLAAAPIWLEPRQRLLLFYLDVMQYRAWTFFAPACSFLSGSTMRSQSGAWDSSINI